VGKRRITTPKCPTEGTPVKKEKNEVVLTWGRGRRRGGKRSQVQKVHISSAGEEEKTGQERYKRLVNLVLV